LKHVTKTILCTILAIALASPSFAAQTAESSATEVIKDWTFLVYINADNNLDAAGVDDLNEMEKVGSTSKVNLLVQLDREHGPTNRHFVKKGSNDIVEAMGEVNMGDWNQLVDFAKWGIEKYPAKRYALVVWNHGSGWKKHRNILHSRGISYDDTNGSHITTNQLAKAMTEVKTILGRKIDILGFDACLMNMIEVCYEVRNSAEYIVGSEETEPGDGWPYDKLCAKLVAKPSMSAAKLGDVIVSAYKKSYKIMPTTQSAIKTSALEELIKRINNFTFCVKVAKQEAAVTAALKEVQRFAYKENIDLFHFLELFIENAPQTPAKAAAKELLQFKNTVVTANGVSGVPFTKMKARGLAIYFPTKYGYYSRYEKLEFAKDSGWDEFLREQLGLSLQGETPGDERIKKLQRD